MTDLVRFITGSMQTVAQHWSLAILSEGYTQAQLDAGDFQRDAFSVANLLLATAPFNDPGLRPLVDIVMISVPSIQTGNDIKMVCPAPPSSPFNTPFKALFCHDKAQDGSFIQRALYGDSDVVRETVWILAGLPSVTNFLVIVNNTLLDGGEAHDQVGWFSKVGNWQQTAVHELGHRAFGLADEYSYDNNPGDTIRFPATAEPVAPNVTLQTDPTKMKWRDLISLPFFQIPSTKPDPPGTCSASHDVLDGLPAGAVGAFEGAHHHACGVFRPSATCLMRDQHAAFCRVCESAVRSYVGGYFLSPTRQPERKSIGTWTHVQAFTVLNECRYLAYNSASGAYAIATCKDVEGQSATAGDLPLIVPGMPAFGRGTIDPFWTWLAPFTQDGTLQYLAHNVGSGGQAKFVMSDNGLRLTQTWTSSPGITWTHILTLTVGGAPHALSYNSFTGAVSVARINSGNADPTLLYTTGWNTGITALTAYQMSGQQFVLSYETQTGTVTIWTVDATHAVPTFTGSKLWKPGLTHATAFEENGQQYVVRYSGVNGDASIYHLRAGGAGVDFVCSLNPIPGPGGLSVFGAGIPAWGRIALNNVVTTFQSHNLFFYNFATGRLDRYFVGSGLTP